MPCPRLAAMAFDEALGERVRTILASRKDVGERRMFGGLVFMINGHMACGVIHDDLFVRVGSDGLAEALARTHTRPMDFTGKPSRELVYVAPAGTTADADLARWVAAAVAHAEER
jgi:TfoX/Sxy family transcriptional regulator of competence genes